MQAVATRGQEVRPIHTQGHLNGAFHYTFRQEQHHGICVDTCFDASNLPDFPACGSSADTRATW
jgi:hypothetical protein